MASPSGTSSGSTSLIQNSGSEGDLLQLMDQRKRKRMISNRESARRSRMRKQKHLDDLTAEVARLREENHRIIASIGVATRQYLNFDGENSVLRAQAAELSRRLESMNEIIAFVNAANSCFAMDPPPATIGSTTELMNSTWSYPYLNQAIMPSADLLQY
ncbi:hypothetical protein U1Q18_034838 [Sarracenia purpurea var. burkii]